MKENLKLEIDRSLGKIKNLQKTTVEVEKKLENLQSYLESLLKSIEAEKRRIASLGVKTPSKDRSKPDSPEIRRKKEEFNQKLLQEKEKYLAEKLGESQLRPDIIRLAETFKS